MPIDQTDIRKHTISLLVANKPGVLIRISLVFARRGFNIDSLVVSESQDPDFSVMNIVASGDSKTLDQIIKQLTKLVDIVRVRDRTIDDTLQRELALFKLRTDAHSRVEILQIAQSLNCETIEIGLGSIILQAQGNSETIDGLTRVLRPFGIIEIVRTGKVLMARGDQPTS
jgi:acetolactate synthase-1/3 small subunit